MMNNKTTFTYRAFLPGVAVALTLLVATSTVSAQPHVLFADGKTDYSIFLSSEASQSEAWAARELQHWLKEIGDVTLALNYYQPTETLPEQAPRIYVGFSPTLQSKIGEEEPKWKDESFRYFNRGPEIYIYGGKERGTMYGVFSFLENEFGCRWYAPGVDCIPTRSENRFETLDHRETPGLRVRNDFFHTAFDPVWMARNKLNGRMSSNPAEQPGGCESYWGVHTFYTFVPPSEFYDKHPEYFSLIDGKRVADPDNPDWGKRAQLCLSNPNVPKLMIRRVKDFIRKNPEHAIYSVSQNDWRNPCQCAKCQALVKKHGGEGGHGIRRNDWIHVLGRMGIPYTTKGGKVKMLSNNISDSLTDEEIKSLLSGSLVIDGQAAETLFNSGWGKWLGLTNVEKLDTSTEVGFGSERTDKYVLTPSDNVQSVQNLSSHSVLDWVGGDTSRDNKRDVSNPDLVLFENELGGRVAVFALSLSNNNSSQVFNYKMKEWLRQVVEWAGNEPLPLFVKNQPNAFCIFNRERAGKYGIATIISICSDLFDTFELDVAPEWSNGKVERLNEQGKWVPAEISKTDSGFIVKEPLAYLTPLFLKFSSLS